MGSKGEGEARAQVNSASLPPAILKLMEQLGDALAEVHPVPRFAVVLVFFLLLPLLASSSRSLLGPSPITRVVRH